MWEKSGNNCRISRNLRDKGGEKFFSGLTSKLALRLFFKLERLMKFGPQWLSRGYNRHLLTRICWVRFPQLPRPLRLDLAQNCQDRIERSGETMSDEKFVNCCHGHGSNLLRNCFQTCSMESRCSLPSGRVAPAYNI